MTVEKRRIELKPYTLKELALVYDVCVRTINKWLIPFKDEIGSKQGRYYNVNQVKIVFEKLGLPGNLED
jgi:hypothetical protein